MLDGVQLAGVRSGMTTCASSNDCCARAGSSMSSKLDHALTLETRVLALTVVDRESMLWALDEPPTDALAELRGVLLSEHEWRVREGLVRPGSRRAG